MSQKRKKINNNIIRFGFPIRMWGKKGNGTVDYKTCDYYKRINGIPELVLEAERLGMVAKPGYRFNGYFIREDLVGEMLYQLKLFFNWNAKEAYLFFRQQFKIVDVSTNKLSVDYEII